MSSEEQTLTAWLEAEGKLDNITILNKAEITALLTYCIAFTSNIKIASALGLDGERLKTFLRELKDPASPIRQIVDIARLKHSGDVAYNAALRAKESVAGLKSYNSLVAEEKADELREMLVPQIEADTKSLFRSDAKDELSYFQDLQDWFLSAKPTESIPDALQSYWTKLNIVDDLLRSFEYRAKGRKYIMNIIRNKFGCSEQYAYRIINESISFFNISEDKQSILRRLLDDLEIIKAIAYASKKDELFIQAVKEQINIAQQLKSTSEVPPEIFEGRMIVTSHNPEEFGIDKVDRKELFHMIKKWKLSKAEETKILNEIDYDKTE